MTKEIKFKTVLSTLKKGEKACYRPTPLTNGAIDMVTLERNAAARIGMDEALMIYIGELFMGQVRKSLCEGRRIEVEGLYSGGISVQGVFDAANAKWERGKHRLSPNFTAKGEMRTVLADGVGVNVTEGNRCRITSVIDAIRKQEGVIVQGEDVAVYAAGATFLVDVTAPDEGAWLENEDGTVAELATVTASTSTTLDCVFEQTPEPGKYKFVVATRGGLGKDYGVSIAKRNVTVVAAE